ncbi:hypothetical protein ACQKWADRAFT_272661 [Trichoderma austrokoningii]
MNHSGKPTSDNNSAAAQNLRHTEALSMTKFRKSLSLLRHCPSFTERQGREGVFCDECPRYAQLQAVDMQVGAIRTHKLPCPAAPPHDVLRRCGFGVARVVQSKYSTCWTGLPHGAQQGDTSQYISPLHAST